MKALLLYPDRDADLASDLPPRAAVTGRDLELRTLFDAMSAGDRFVFEVVSKVVLTSLATPETIRYRQRAIEDGLRQPHVVRELYASLEETVEEARKRRFGLFPGASATTVMHGAVGVLEFLTDRLVVLRGIADREGAGFSSPAFARLFGMLQAELSDEYMRRIRDQLAYMKFPLGVPNSARLGPGNRGVGYVLRRTSEPADWWHRLIQWRQASSSSFEIDPRDQAGMHRLADIQGLGVNAAANALARSADHILSFLRVLRGEVAFYVGCLNLHDRLTEARVPTCFPSPLPLGDRGFSASGLYDVCLSLHLGEPVVGNDIELGGRSLLVITGANQGGKSTLLRAIGLAHLMMQCGLFVGARALRADVRDGLFTHFIREEDDTMQSGKLDEELRRMSAIVDEIHPGSLLLCNESFASTSEREGSEIARQVTRAFMDAGIKVVFVTHLFDLAEGFYRDEGDAAAFLRAERLPDGRRTFRIVPDEPLPTSYGHDLWRRIFETTSAPAGP
jgi:MutS domain V